MTVKLAFHGAAGCVTGFCAHLTTGRAQLLIDCGLFQGPKTLKALNYDPFPFEPKAIDAVLLTHAHIDHSGQLPKLMRRGYAGPIYATAATRDLCAVLLPDAGHIQEDEVGFLNRRNQHRGRESVQPIFTARDGERVIRQFETIKYGEWAEVGAGVRARYWNAGHILGSASIELEIEDDDGPLRLLFSGDLGPGGRDYECDPEAPGGGIHHLVMESTYGDRERVQLDATARRAMLAQELRDAHAAGGPLVIPAFAVERTQELLADLIQVMEAGEAPSGDIFLDSPLAIKATEVFLKRGWQSDGHNPFAGIRDPDRVYPLVSPSDSDQLERIRGWHVIMAASGMCDAGRIRKHLKRLLWRPEATVLLSGFQAAGTLGRLLQEGRPMVRIQGEPIRVRARIRSFDVYSGHADGGGLVAWAKARGRIAGKVFLLHGEPTNSEALKQRLSDRVFQAAQIVIPRMDQGFTLSLNAATETAEPCHIAPEAPTAPDWHNLRAELLNDLELRLEAAVSDAERRRILLRLREALAVQSSAARN